MCANQRNKDKVKESDTISVAMTTYNGGRFLREQLDSLYAQTRVPDEVVVCDDSSSDDTLGILEDYHQRYGLRYYKNEPALGVNANFMRAMSLCEGDYICICDQDDIWFENKIETLYNAIRTEKVTACVAVSSLRDDVNAKGEIINPNTNQPTTRGWADTLMSVSGSQGCTMIMSRYLSDKVQALYKQNPLADKLMYDVLISVTAAILGDKINLGAVLMHYRHHDANVVDRFLGKKKSFWRKVGELPTYYPFVMDYRITELAVVSQLFSEEDVAKDVKEFLGKMQRLEQKKRASLGALLFVLGIKQIPLKLRVKVAFISPVVMFLKFIKRHFVSAKRCQ